MAIGAAVGVAIAQTQSHNRFAYSVMYGGVGAAATGLVSSYYRTRDVDELSRENIKLQNQITEFEKKLNPKLLAKGESLFSSPLPREVSGLVDLGEWKHWRVDEWVRDQADENTWYRQTEMFEIVPPVSR